MTALHSHSIAYIFLLRNCIIEKYKEVPKVIIENHKVSDYLVPYTSSGCTASCMYCYLVCNYNKCAYLRLFVNREQMLDKIAPVIFVENWKKLYLELIQRLNEELTEKVKKDVFFEIIFMTYSYVHTKINEEAFPNAIDLYNKDIMTGRGRGKYWYKAEIRNEGEKFFREEMEKYFSNNRILYIV